MSRNLRNVVLVVCLVLVVELLGCSRIEEPVQEPEDYEVMLFQEVTTGKSFIIERLDGQSTLYLQIDTPNTLEGLDNQADELEKCLDRFFEDMEIWPETGEEFILVEDKYDKSFDILAINGKYVILWTEEESLLPVPVASPEKKYEPDDEEWQKFLKKCCGKALSLQSLQKQLQEIHNIF